MKKVFFITIVFSLSLNLTASRKMVEKDFVDQVVNNPFKTFKIDHEKAKTTIEHYFGKTPYKVIWAKPFGYNNTMVYFVVEEYKPEKYYNAIKKGIMVKEDGVVDSILDIEKGLYANKISIIDFKEIGFKHTDIQCIILRNASETGYWINIIVQTTDIGNENASRHR